MPHGHKLVPCRLGAISPHRPLCQASEGQLITIFFQTYIHIIDQRTRKPVPTMFYTDPMVVFHHVNAYEKDGCILFDVIAYEDSSLYQLFYLANLNQDFEENSRLTSVPTLRRFAIPLHVDKVRLHRVGSFFLDRLEPRWDGTWHLFD
jgi:hypothetical protein